MLRGNRVGTPLKHDFPFRRFIRCSECGRSLIGERKKGRYVYYRCHTLTCPSTCLTETAIDDEIRAKLMPLRFSAEEFRDLRDLVEEKVDQQTNDRAAREASLRVLIAKCDDRIARLTDALIDGVINKETFDHRNAMILSEKRGLKDRLETVASMPSLADRIREKVELANTAYLSYETGNLAEKRNVLRSVTSNFRGTGKSPAITLKSPFQELWNWRKSHDGDPCRDDPRTRAKQMLDILMAVDIDARNATEPRSSRTNANGGSSWTPHNP